MSYMKKVLLTKKKRNYSTIKHEPQRKLRNSVYYNEDTKRMIERKSEELQLSQNKITELCLQRYLPEMSLSVQ